MRPPPIDWAKPMPLCPRGRGSRPRICGRRDSRPLRSTDQRAGSESVVQAVDSTISPQFRGRGDQVSGALLDLKSCGRQIVDLDSAAKLNSQGPHLIAEAAPCDAQHASGLGLISSCMAKDPSKQIAAPSFRQRPCTCPWSHSADIRPRRVSDHYRVCRGHLARTRPSHVPA